MIQDDVSIAVMLIALHFVVSLDYGYFVYFLNDFGQKLCAIHLNDVYLCVPKVNGFALDSKSVQYLLNVSNYSELEHFASYFEVMQCAQNELML